jgi:hypothetical protein
MPVHTPRDDATASSACPHTAHTQFSHTEARETAGPELEGYRLAAACPHPASPRGAPDSAVGLPT